MGEAQGINVMFGVVVPSVIFVISFVLTYMLYLHFSKKAVK